jgi:hypothetical protein
MKARIKPEDRVKLGGLNMKLYDLNKQVISQLPNLTEFNEIIENINEFSKSTNNIHYMLYGKEQSYFTVFKKEDNNTETLGEAIIDCLTNVGDIKTIELTEAKDAFEIWVTIDGEATCLYLFPYDSGIVKIGGQ